MESQIDDQTAICATVPARVKAALVRRARKEGISVNDFCGRALGERFRVPFDQSGRRPCTFASPHTLTLVLRLPTTLTEEIRRFAYEHKTNMSFEIAITLAQALGVKLKVRPPRRKTPFGGGRSLVA